MKTYVTVNNQKIEATVYGHSRDMEWGDRDSKAIHVSMTYDQAKSLFVDDAPWGITQEFDPVQQPQGDPITPDPVTYDNSEFCMAGPITDNRDGTVTVKMGKPLDGELTAILVGEIPSGITGVRQMRKVIETAIQSVPDEEALQAICLHPAFDDLIGQTVKQGFKFQCDGALWKTRQPSLTFQAHYRPGVGTESLYERVNETNKGTMEDPIPYTPPMEIKNGLYYTENGIKYKCIRDSGIALSHHLVDLIDNYVVKA